MFISTTESVSKSSDESTFTITIPFDETTMRIDINAGLSPDVFTQPTVSAAAKQQQDNFEDSVSGTCTALSSVAATMSMAPPMSSDETNVPAAFFPATGTLIMQDMPRGQRKNAQPMLAPILVDVEWATYFFNRVTELLKMLEQQVSKSNDSTSP
jgi:hypothetical protein